MTTMVSPMLGAGRRGFTPSGAVRLAHAMIAPPSDGGRALVQPVLAEADEAWFFAKKANEARQSEVHELRKFVKKELFPKWKCFTNKTQLMWTIKPESICQFVCSSMNLKPAFKERWWHLNQDNVTKELNRKRSDVASAMKRLS